VQQPAFGVTTDFPRVRLKAEDMPDQILKSLHAFDNTVGFVCGMCARVVVVEKQHCDDGQ
jgi:hypothetical protein